MGDNDLRQTTRSRVSFVIRYAMHRQQRLRSSSSSLSSLVLPLSVTRPSIPTATVSPAMPMSFMRTSTAMSTTPSSVTTFLPSSAAWSTPSMSYSWTVQQTSCPRLSSLPSESSAVSTISIPCPRLVSILAWSVTLLLVSSCIGLTDAGILNGHPLGKRSFIDIQCKGIYDKSIFARLDRICEDCYNLFREPQLHQLCRKNCFTSDYFKGCLDVLLLQDEVEKIQTWIKQLHGAEPGV